MPPDFVGGIGMEGAANVRRFVERGGWMVAWDRASDFAILALDLPLRNSVRETRSEEFFIPGSLLRINTKPAHPLAAGMEASAVAMFADSQAFQLIAPAAEGKQRAARDVDVYVEYPRQNFMVSGWELGGSRYLAGRVAAAHVRVRRGPRRRDGLPPALARPAAQHLQAALQSAVLVDDRRPDAHDDCGSVIRSTNVRRSCYGRSTSRLIRS